MRSGCPSFLFILIIHSDPTLQLSCTSNLFLFLNSNPLKTRNQLIEERIFYMHTVITRKSTSETRLISCTRFLFNQTNLRGMPQLSRPRNITQPTRLRMCVFHNKGLFTTAIIKSEEDFHMLAYVCHYGSTHIKFDIRFI